MNVKATDRKWYWMPASVFLIGIFSIILLFGFDRIKNHQIIYSTLVDAILDIEIKTATFHLQLEEEMKVGQISEVVRGATAEMDQAISLADMVLNIVTGPRKGLIPNSVNGSEVRTCAEELKSLLGSLKNKGVVQRQEFGDALADQEFDAAYAVVLAKAAVLSDIFKSARAENRRKMEELFLGIIFVWSLAVIAATGGLWRMEMRRNAAEQSLLKANSLLQLQAEELMAHRENLAGLVEKRTSELSAANSQLRFEVVERRQAEERLRQSERHIRALSSQLLRAQEIERKRISMELHDGLGQALNVTKLRIRSIENGLAEGQGPVRENCESLLDYLDEVIEEVRRLSLSLSPAILEDLGLTSALKWLVSDFRRIHPVEVISEIDEIDDLFPENHLVTVYRVVQEALANVGKHAEAGRVSVVIRRCEGRVAFTVEDDGKGFDSDGYLNSGVSKNGLGLMTMNERVRMMGGVFDLWSRPGEGTRINFSVPLGKGEV